MQTFCVQSEREDDQTLARELAQRGFLHDDGSPMLLLGDLTEEQIAGAVVAARARQGVALALVDDGDSPARLLSLGVNGFVPRSAEVGAVARRLVDELATLQRARAFCGESYGDVLLDEEPPEALTSMLLAEGGSLAPLLLTGQEGQPLEVVARALHRLSPRRWGPFVTVSTAGLSEDRLMQKLFGEELGEDDAALQSSPLLGGRLEVARGGTLFIDDVSALPPRAQAGLLSALPHQEAPAARLFDVGEEPDIDVRIMLGSRAAPRKLLDEGKVHRDLLARLRVLSADAAFPQRGDPEIRVPGMTLQEMERIAILRTYALHRSTKATADALGVSIRTIQYRLKEYRLSGYLNDGVIKEAPTGAGAPAPLPEATPEPLPSAVPSTGSRNAPEAFLAAAAPRTPHAAMGMSARPRSGGDGMLASTSPGRDGGP